MAEVCSRSLLNELPVNPCVKLDSQNELERIDFLGLSNLLFKG
jgi:hypothetical protein